MSTEVIKFSKAELLEVTGKELARRIHEDMSNASAEANGDGRRRGKKKKSTLRPRDVTDEQVLDLIRTNGPQRLVEIKEATGLTHSAIYKKVTALMGAGTLKTVREGTMIRYDLARGKTAARKTAPKGEKVEKAEKPERRRRSKRSAQKAATGEAATS